jgi:hypothetical protein
MNGTKGKISETQFMAMAELTNLDGTMTVPSPLGMFSKPTVRRLLERGLIEARSEEPTTWAAASRGRKRIYVLTHEGRVALHEHRQGLR